MLVQPGLERADIQHVPCYLETHDETNVPFYTRRGFVLVRTGQVPGTDLRFWCLLREPRDKPGSTRVCKGYLDTQVRRGCNGQDPQFHRASGAMVLSASATRSRRAPGLRLRVGDYHIPLEPLDVSPPEPAPPARPSCPIVAR